MCKLLGVSRSGYYEWQQQTSPSSRSLENEKLSKGIKLIFTEHKSRYGSRRIRREFLKQGYAINRRRVCKLMKAQSLYCKTRRKFKHTTDSNHHLPIAANLLERNFKQDKPNQVYVSDITYIPTEEGWLYLAVIIDLDSRQIVGWSMNKRMKASLVNDALLMAIKKCQPTKGLISHSDKGSQYASNSHRALLQAYGIKQSMSRRDNCWDNSVAESFFHTLKVELVHHEKYKTRDEAKQNIFHYVEVYYNRTRMHSANDYLSPVEFEQQRMAA